MKIGDLVYLMVDEAISPYYTGVIISEQLETGWYEVLRCTGGVIMWPPNQMRKINEKA